MKKGEIECLSFYIIVSWYDLKSSNKMQLDIEMVYFCLVQCYLDPTFPCTSLSGGWVDGGGQAIRHVQYVTISLNSDERSNMLG